MLQDIKKVVPTSKESTLEKPSRHPSPLFEMEQMMEHFLDKGDWLSPFHFYRPSWPDIKPTYEGRTLKVDMIDRDKEVVIKAELPGVKKDDIDVAITDDLLTIKASTRHEEEKEDGEYHRRELSRGEFVRTLRLPADVDTSKSVAKFNDGLLELTLPKVEAAKRRSIKIE